MRLLVLVALVACGRIGFDDRLDERVPRLRPRWIVFDDARAPYGLYDTVLESPCSPASLSDGRTYCVPYGLGTGLNYTDAACTAPVVGIPPVCDGTPTFLILSDRCLQDVYRRGDVRSISTWYRRDAAGTCLDAGAVPAGFTVFDVGPRVDAATELAGMIAEAPEGSGRLRVRRYRGDDGVVVAGPYHDAQYGFDCLASTQLDGARACVPIGRLAVTGEFEDAECTAPKFQMPAACAPVQLGFAGVDACGRPEIHGLVPAPATPLFDVVGTCVAATPDPTAMYARTSGVVTLASIDYVPAAGSGRIVPVERTVGGEPVGADPVLFDQLLAERCTPNGFGTEPRCIPVAMAVVTRFTDAACTQPIELGTMTTPAGCSQPVPTTALDDLRCGIAPRARRRGARFAGTVYQQTETACLDVTVVPGVEYYALGEDVELAAGTVEIEGPRAPTTTSP